jgi:hypothetical protein
MRSILTTSLIGALAGVLVTAGTAAAADELVAKVPFPFVANGHNFPAGQYTIERAGSSPSVLLIRSENGRRTAAFVATRPAGNHAPGSEMPALQFKKHENQYRLSAVWESANDGFEVME